MSSRNDQKCKFQLSLLGKYSLRLDDSEVAETNRGVTRLIAFLGVYGESERAEIAKTLWPRAEQPQALMSLRQSLQRAKTEGLAQCFLIGRKNLALSTAVHVDLAEALAILDWGGDSEGAQAIELLRRGLLPEWSDPWLRAPRERVANLTDLRTDFLSDPRTPDQITVSRSFLEMLTWFTESDPPAAWQYLSDTLSLWPRIPAKDLVRPIRRLLQRSRYLKAEWAPAVADAARVFYLVGYHQESIQVYERLAEECGQEAPEHYMVGLGSISVVLRETGRMAECQGVVEKLARAAMRAQHPLSDALAKYSSAMTLIHSLELVRGVKLGSQAVGRAELAGLAELPGLFWHANLALAYYDLGDLTSAQEHFARVAPIARATGDRLAILTMRFLGALLEKGMQPALQQTSLHRTARAAQSAGNLQFAAVVQECRAALAHKHGLGTDRANAYAESLRLRAQSHTLPTPLEEWRLRHVRDAIGS